MSSELFIKAFGSSVTPDTTAGTGYIRCNPFTGVGNAVNAMRFLSGSAGTIRVAIYDDNAGSPLNLLIESAATTVVAGWNVVDFQNSLSISAGTTYWLSTQGTVNVEKVLVSGVLPIKYKLWTFGAFENPLTSLSSTTGYDVGLQAGLVTYTVCYLGARRDRMDTRLVSDRNQL